MDPGIKLLEKEDGLYLQLDRDEAWTQRERSLVTTELLGKARAPDLPYLNYDGAPLTIDVDYFGDGRNSGILFPGPFDELKDGRQAIKVWPKE
jgi:alpha-N-arabinofuranosidase